MLSLHTLRAHSLGSRTLVAMTCYACGVLKDAQHFRKHRRRDGQIPYIDRRCRSCRWRHLESDTYSSHLR